MPLRTVLVPTDLSPDAERAFGPAARLAIPHGATVVVVRVTPEPTAPAGGRVTRQTTPRVGDEAFDLVPVVQVDVAAREVAAAIVAQAARVEADLVVMSTQGRSGLARLRLGSVAEAVARTAPCPVLLVPTRADVDDWQPARLLAAVRPGALASETIPVPLAWAAWLATQLGSRLDVLSVARVSPTSRYESLRESAAGLLSLTLQLRRTTPSSLVVDYVARADGFENDPTAEILDEALRLDADLVVVGTAGRQGLPRLTLGSVAEGVARRAACPVLIVSPGAPPPPAPEARKRRPRSGADPLSARAQTTLDLSASAQTTLDLSG